MSVFNNLQAIGNIQGGFLLLTLKSWLFQDWSPKSCAVNPPDGAQLKWNLSLATSDTVKRTAASWFPGYFLHNFSAVTLLWSYSYKKSLINHYHKKVKQRFSTKNWFLKRFFKVKENNNSGVLRLNQMMSKLLIIRKFLQINC